MLYSFCVEILLTCVMLYIANEYKLINNPNQQITIFNNFNYKKWEESNMENLRKRFDLILWFGMLINLGWGLAIGCESPVIILVENLIPWIISVFIVTLIYHLTLNSETLHVMLIPLLGLWFIHYLYALIFHYHLYDTLVKGVGLLTTLSCYVHASFNRKKS